MTENSTSGVGRAAIDAYLDSIEQALLAAHAPRSDRVQVLADLEAQIADMLAREPQPLTEEVVKAVIARLEPPSHFAAMYGNGKHGAAVRNDVVRSSDGLCAADDSLVACRSGLFCLAARWIVLRVGVALWSQGEWRYLRLVDSLWTDRNALCTSDGIQASPHTAAGVSRAQFGFEHVDRICDFGPGVFDDRIHRVDARASAGAAGHCVVLVFAISSCAEIA